MPSGLLGAGLARALALHSRQGREPLRGNQQETKNKGRVHGGVCSCQTGLVATRNPGFCARFRNGRSAKLRTPSQGAFKSILAVGAEALPVTPSGGALFAS